MVSIVQFQFYAVRKERQQKEAAAQGKIQVQQPLCPYSTSISSPLQFECFRDGNIATAQARNSENMSAQGFVPATRAGKNPFVRTGTGYSIFICYPDGDLSIPNSFLTTTNPVVKRCAKRNKLAERGSYQMKAGKAHGFNRGMIGRQLRFSWNKIRAEEAHCVSGGGVYAFFKRSDYVQSVNITLFGLFLHQKNVIMPV